MCVHVFFSSRTPSEAYASLLSANLDSYPPALYIFEDQLVGKKSADPKLVEFFTAGSNHFNLSVCVTSQVLYGPNTDLRTIALNSTVLGIWESFRDRKQLNTLTSQLYPTYPTSFLNDCVKLANRTRTTNYRVPLFLQLSTNYFAEQLRVVSGLLSSEELIVYRPTQSR